MARRSLAQIRRGLAGKPEAFGQAVFSAKGAKCNSLGHRPRLMYPQTTALKARNNQKASLKTCGGFNFEVQR